LLGTSRALGVGAREFASLDKDAQKAVKNGAAWIPGEVSKGRTDGSVGHIEALVLDFDALYVSDVARLWERLSPWLYVAHTSASHTEARPKWRAALAITSPVSAGQWRERWCAAIARLELRGRLAPDKVARNPSRLYYLPAHLADVAPGWRVNRSGVPLAMSTLPALPPSKPLRAPTIRWESSDFERQASRFIAKIPPAVEGAHGDDTTYRVACVLVRDFGLTDEQAMPLFLGWNAQCAPPWSEDDLRRKLQHARRYGKQQIGCRRSAGRAGGLDGNAALAFMKSFVGSNA
jgi:hypothetical protein